MQELIISNSSPIIHLAKIDQLDLLRDFFGSCVTDDSREGFSGVIYNETWESVMVVTAYFDNEVFADFGEVDG